MLGRNASGQNTAASAINNVSVGYNAFAKMSGAKDSVAIGCQAMKAMVSGSNNTAIGSRALELSTDGKSNVAIGAFAGSTLAGGDNNILIGDNAAPSSPTVSNEITLGNNDTTVLRMGNGDVVYPSSGSEAVAFKGGLSANQAVTFQTWTKVNINTSIFDTDSALTDGKFQPKVAGYYQVNGTVNSESSSTNSLRTISAISLNGVRTLNGVDLAFADGSGWVSISTVSTVVYLNGTTDYVELYGYVSSTGANSIASGQTQLSAVLVSGGSGDSTRVAELEARLDALEKRVK